MPSQLKQLKLTLRDSGLSRTSQPKDAKKRAKQRKQLSSGSAQHRTAKLDAIGKDFNKFDLREENKKFQVVTRQGKLEEGKKGAPGKSRAAGVELRKKTLLPMLENRTHTSTFLDHRFGENSATLTPEEKALERFTAERQARLANNGSSKKSRFNLEDDEDDDADNLSDSETLTHGGRKLGFGDEDELEAGGWGGLSNEIANDASSSNREPLLRRRMAVAAGEQEDELPPKKRSKAEIMEEVMLKAKSYKYERQKTRSADDETRLSLDAELKDLRVMLGGGGQIAKPTDASAANSKNGTDNANHNKKAGSREKETISIEEDTEKFDQSAADNSSDEEDEQTDDESGSEGEGSTYELDDEELEAALAASGKSGVDRELLRKLIGGSTSDDEEDEKSHERGQLSAFEMAGGDRPEPAKQEPVEHDQYDLYVRQLALEPRAHASDRMKTPLELAEEAAKELVEREEARLKRQRGEEEEGSDEDDAKVSKGRRNRKRAPQADDLEDDFLKDQDVGEDSDTELATEGLGQGLQVISSNSHSATIGEDGDEHSVDEDASIVEEESDDDELVGDIEATDSEEEEVDGEQEALVPSIREEPTKKRQWGRDGVTLDLPFTFPCPASHQELLKLLENHGINGVNTATVVKRIRVLYHPGLGVSNKERLQVFTNVLLDHMLHVASQPSDESFKEINSLLPHFLTLSHAYPLTTAPYYVDKLALMQKNFVRGLSQGALDPSSKTWPGVQELVFLRLVGILWSTSDLSHPVAAPAMLLICQYLAQARTRNLSDIASGLFLCGVASQYETFSKRLAPECINFLIGSLLILAPNSFTRKTAPGAFPIPDFKQNDTDGLCLRCIEDLQPSQLNLLSSLTNKDPDDQFKVDLLATLLALLKDMAEKYVSLDAAIEIFRPAQLVLSKINTKLVPRSISHRIMEVDASIKSMIRFASQSRKPLSLQQHKPIPITTYIPKFDEGFNPNSKFDPDTERAEANKIRSLYKKEKKGAIRELRKDNKFLAGVEAKKKEEADAVYSKKIAKIMGSLQDERAEEKSFQKTKERLKRQDKARSSRK